MKNNLFFKFKNKIEVNIKGKNINNFIKRLNSNKIDLLKINYINKDTVNILIYKKDYDKIIKLKTIYEVTQVDIYGIIKVKKIINMYKYVIFFFILGLICIYLLSNIIFEVDVIDINSETRSLLIKELETNGLKKFGFKKNYNEIQNIKNNILEKYKDKIEWLEIEAIGTKYVVRLQNRIIKNEQENNEKQNIVASKDAIIKKIVAEKGTVLKEINSYVKKGEVVISGQIYLYEELKETVRASGTIYGEVWYNVTVEYPYIYSEIKETGNTKENYALQIFNKNIELSFKKYKEKLTSNDTILVMDILPVKLVKEHQRETKTISLILTEEQATKKALEEAISKMKDSLATDEEIINYQVIKKDVKDDKVVINVFFNVLENITDYVKIEGE